MNAADDMAREQPVDIWFYRLHNGFSNPKGDAEMRVDHNLSWIDGAAIAVAAGLAESVVSQEGEDGRYELARLAYNIAEALFEEKKKREAE